MINPDALRAYHRQLCLHIMQISGGDFTAAEVHETMTSASLAVGHPKQCAEITPAAVAGLLRSLQSEQLVTQVATKPNTRYGRHEPTWRAQPELQHMQLVPFPPSPGTKPAKLAAPVPAQTNAAPTGDPSGLSREHAVLLMVGDALSTATARFMADVEEIKQRARAMLVDGPGQ